MTAMPRQIWMKGKGFAPCEHTHTRDILSGGGEVIAVECSACSHRIWELGDCNGCHKQRQRITKTRHTQKGWLRFCDGVCETNWLHQEKLRRRVNVMVAK
jgi:hypothetical protein